jgi:hypothetical protein
MEKGVMAGLVPAIHVFLSVEDVDARDKPGHDERAQREAVIASEAKQSISPQGDRWIGSSLRSLAQTFVAEKCGMGRAKRNPSSVTCGSMGFASLYPSYDDVES